jgi:hypothetical protein
MFIRRRQKILFTLLLGLAAVGGQKGRKNNQSAPVNPEVIENVFNPADPNAGYQGWNSPNS